MGRAARAKHGRRRPPAAPPPPRRVALERADYLELAMLGERAHRIESEARAAAAAFAGRLQTVQQQRDQLLERLGRTHGFAPRGSFQLEDEQCTLVVLEETETTRT